ncbi:MAG: GNAT family N-acetyltransferase [Alistipes ihumii]
MERLRGSRHSFPGSLVAECDGIVVGYALMSEWIESDGNYEISLALAPVAVLPEFQRQGISSALIEAYRRAADSGYRSAVVLGHKDYYPRFGYRKAADFGIAFPFGLPQECCMAVELLPGGLEGVSGTVRYPRPFMECR